MEKIEKDKNIFQIKSGHFLVLDIITPPLTKFVATRSLYYFLYCFKNTYYTFLTPHKFEVGCDGHISIKYKVLNKWFVGFLHIYALLLQLQWIASGIDTLSQRTARDPGVVYDFLANFIVCISTIDFYYTVWFKEEAWLKFLRTLDDIPKVVVDIDSKRHDLQEYIILAILFACSPIFVGLGLATSSGFGGVGLNFGIKSNILQDYKTMDTVYDSITFFFFSYTMLMTNVGLIFSYCGCCAIYQMGRESSAVLYKLTPLNEVAHYYECLKKAVFAMNELIGIQVLTTVINVLLYFSKSLTQVFKSGDILLLTIIIVYTITSVLYFMLAANGSSKLYKIGDYLFEHRNNKRMNTLELSDILLLKEDITFNPLGLKAYEFVINFGLLVSIFSTVLTYSIVLLQFENSTKENLAHTV